MHDGSLEHVLVCENGKGASLCDNRLSKLSSLRLRLRSLFCVLWIFCRRSKQFLALLERRMYPGLSTSGFLPWDDRPVSAIVVVRTEHAAFIERQSAVFFRLPESIDEQLNCSGEECSNRVIAQEKFERKSYSQCGVRIRSSLRCCARTTGVWLAKAVCEHFVPKISQSSRRSIR